MAEPDKIIGRMSTEGGSVSRDDKPKIDDTKTGGAEFSTNKAVNFQKIPKELEIADLTTTSFDIVRTKLTFVDKSEYIERFFECPSSVVQITAPNHFGKSTFMDMLKDFLKITVNEDATPISNPADCDKYKLFMNLKLGLEDPEFVKKHCGQYPVIFMSLKDVAGVTEGDIVDTLKQAICEAFQEHSYLLKIAADGSRRFKNCKLRGINRFLNHCDHDRLKHLSETDITFALQFLSKILHDHFNKQVVLLIDDADAPILKGVIQNMDDKTLRYLIRCIQNMMSVGLKGNTSMARALVNSCVGLSGGFSHEFNNMYDCRFLQNENFDGAYGFTAEEVDNLFEKSEFQALKDFAGIEKWYGGYRIVDNKKTRIYSSWSILNYLQKSVPLKQKMFDSYWAKSDFVDILGNLFVNPQIQKQVDILLKNESISISVEEPRGDKILQLKKTIWDPQNELQMSHMYFFLQVLYDNGLFTAVNKYVLKIPNWEIKREIQRKCYNQSLFQTKYKLKLVNVKRYTQSLKQLLLIKASGEEETDQHEEEALREFVNAVAVLFSDGAVIPCNVSELHHILFWLAHNSTTLSAVVMKASEEVQVKKLKKKPKEARVRKNEYDMCVTLGTVGVIFEWKCCKKEETETSKCALRQIIDKQYYKIFDMEEYKDVETKMYVGLCLKENLNVTAHYLVNITDVDKAKFLESTATETTKADTSSAIN